MAHVNVPKVIVTLSLTANIVASRCGSFNGASGVHYLLRLFAARHLTNLGGTTEA
ncbi:hypothetical protein PAECIP111802_03815 [Paenibacillus allorhizosphaerae]|uniref:Uncharacterized protein n=1 Tax=Paenibacillus allorhizosphaerae TaxID=2849866 RepID=A0ABN7TQV8_9BACL|nr:hypothetical protein PAECIP111802_03815 [Paenibacillus allorhizosphaerae]